MTTSTSCPQCGHRPSADRPALEWSMSVRDGLRSWTCAPCTRGHLDGIETGAL